MQKETLKYISDAMASANIPYEYYEFNGSLDSVTHYFVGEYQEIEPTTEDGMEECTFILTGYSKDILTLENDKQAIKGLFPSIGGKTAILESGTGIALMYDSSFQVPTESGIIKKIQINITVKEWKVE